MPNKCGVVNCKGNYNDANKCRVFKVPREESERKKWLDALPPRENFVVVPDKFFVCEKHWPSNTPTIKLPGGSTRPAVPPSIFDVPPSCLPTTKPPPRQTNVEDQQLNHFLKKDKIASFSEFAPEKQLLKKYDNLITSRSADKLVCAFMTKEYEECKLTVIVENKPTLCSPLIFTAFRNGVRVPLGKILNPNNGLSSYSQFFEAVHVSLNYNVPLDDLIKKAVALLKDQETDDSKKAKKLNFLTHQLQQLASKHFSMKDYCFAVEAFPSCNYELLREYIVLPSKTKMHAIISSVNIDELLAKTFQKVPKEQQKNVFLLVDEVKIRPTVAFSGGVLNGMASNDPDSRATSMLCVMVKCLHRGPSVMVSVTPVHKLTASYQFSVVKTAAAKVERAGGIVLGSITDNHKVNQQYCKLFSRATDCSSQVIHPLDETRVWYLLFDTVHLLKCIRNNWITEKCQRLTIDKKSVGSFSDVKKLYEAEKHSVLKTSPLTEASVCPSKLQLQNVQHVLRVFNDKVVAGLKLQGDHETANFIQNILDWWNVVNVSAKGQDLRMKDHHRSVESQQCNLENFLHQFELASSGHGATRQECLTHDTKKALVQTMRGLVAVCNHLTTGAGFQYVLLREIQSDRLEGEFSVYRQSTGANAFMTSSDVFAACKKRLAKHAACYLENMDFEKKEIKHACIGPVGMDDAAAIELSIDDTKLTSNEESSAAYVAGWLEQKCQGMLTFDEDDPLVASEVKDFIVEVSRGALQIPHESIYQLVRIGLCFVKQAKHRACCRKRLTNILCTMQSFYNISPPCEALLKHLANVLLSGLHNLEKDHQKNGVLLQTSIKRARLME